MKIQFGTTGSQYHLKSVRFGNTGTTGTEATGTTGTEATGSTGATSTSSQGGWNDKYDNYSNE